MLLPLTAAADEPVRLAWPSGATADLAAPVARDLGLFSRHGLDVTLIDAEPNGVDLARRLASGEADAVIGPVSLLLDPMRQGLDAKFTTGVSGGGMRLLAERRARLRHIEDVKHRRVGVADLAGPSRLFFSIMMRRKGIDPFKEVEWVVVATGDQEQALRARSVDAVAASDPQGFYLLRALQAVEVATNLSGSYRQRVSNALACSGRMLRERRPDGASLTSALREASAWASGHVHEAAGLMAGYAPRLSEADRIAMLGSETIGERPFGRALIDDVAEYADELRLLGTFPYEMKVENFARTVCENVLS